MLTQASLESLHRLTSPGRRNIGITWSVMMDPGAMRCERIEVERSLRLKESEGSMKNNEYVCRR